MSNNQNKKWLPIIAIAGALATWGAILAIGAYQAQVGKAAGSDPRKLLVVAVTTGGFLLFWGLMLLASTARQRRRAKRPKSHPNGSDNHTSPPS